MNCVFLLAAAPFIVASSSSLADMKWERRVLMVSAPTERDADLVAQRRIIARWKIDGAARDLSVVDVVGTDVTGAADTAAALRKKYRLSATGFTAILIGKDGGEKLRSAHAIPAAMLQATIDAMPMRQAGAR